MLTERKRHGLSSICHGTNGEKGSALRAILSVFPFPVPTGGELGKLPAAEGAGAEVAVATAAGAAEAELAGALLAPPAGAAEAAADAAGAVEGAAEAAAEGAADGAVEAAGALVAVGTGGAVAVLVAPHAARRALRALAPPSAAAARRS